ncbi:MAG: helix-turn-helix domain-containing protein [Streptosporangiales bacterium]|nr:helix-turn-helix domain-containing protein [Streptosporangiales bacterium]
MSEGAGTESAARVADVLLAFTDASETLGVSEIARRLGLSKAVVHRILRALLTRGLIAADTETRGYRLGQASAMLGARALRDSRLRDAAMPVMRRLHADIGETITLSARVPGGRVYLDQIESRHEIKMTVEVGRRFPLYAGGSSQCMLAFLPEEEREECLAGQLPAITPATVIDPERLRDVLRRVRSRGYAYSHGERQPGAASVAAPIFSFDGSVTGAISVCGPYPRLDEAAGQRYAPLVIAAADRVSRMLGWSGGLPTGATPDGPP